MVTLYSNNRARPNDAGDFEKATQGANAIFGLDNAGKPTIYLRRDATRIEFLEEYKHVQQFREWAKGRSETGAELSKAWDAYLTSSAATIPKIEIEAAEYVRAWLRANGGTAQELEAITTRLAHWQDRYLAAGGRL
jgi:hypothetical protein